MVVLVCIVCVAVILLLVIAAVLRHLLARVPAIGIGDEAVAEGEAQLKIGVDLIVQLQVQGSGGECVNSHGGDAAALHLLVYLFLVIIRVCAVAAELRPREEVEETVNTLHLSHFFPLRAAGSADAAPNLDSSQSQVLSTHPVDVRAVIVTHDDDDDTRRERHSWHMLLLFVLVCAASLFDATQVWLCPLQHVGDNVCLLELRVAKEGVGRKVKG